MIAVPAYDELQARLGHLFQNQDLLREALTHPSVSHEQNQHQPHNQRLEFLGDSVLGLILSRALFEKFPVADEGLLTKSRARLVNAHSLAGHARSIELGSYLILSRGEENSGGRNRASALADAFEAVLGALFLDGGLDSARSFVLREFADDLAALDQPTAIENPKGELQELLQSQFSSAPQYQLLAVSGPDHDRNFECAVLHNGTELARGQSKSKKAAESHAALAALKKLRS